jgi:hypothetical protein
MLASILILFAMPLLDISRVRSAGFRPLMRFLFWLFVVNFLVLMWIGSQHPEPPYVTLGQFCTGFYFAYFLLFLPLLGLIENSFFDLATDPSSSSYASSYSSRTITTSSSSSKTSPLLGQKAVALIQDSMIITIVVSWIFGGVTDLTHAEGSFIN